MIMLGYNNYNYYQLIPNLHSAANIKQMLRSAQLCCIKHNTQTFHITDISNNSETIILCQQRIINRN